MGRSAPLLLLAVAAASLASVALALVPARDTLSDEQLVRAKLADVHSAGRISADEHAKLEDKLTQSLSYSLKRKANHTALFNETRFLLTLLDRGVPRSYDDVIPAGDIGGTLYWKSKVYLNGGAFNYKGEPLPLDHIVAIQERTLTHEGLNLYDGAVWEIALALEGLGDFGDIYERNVLYPSSTGAGPMHLGGLIDIRADSDTYEYGPMGIAGSALEMVTLPGNVTHVPYNGDQPGEPVKELPGALFYRMIGPKYEMRDPLLGDYANAFRYPYPDNDTTTPWNTFGAIHFNDWKPITGENVWCAMLGPLQKLVIKNNTYIKPCKEFKDCAGEVQFGLSILPALMALQSPLGAIYHCPKGCKMYPPDPSEGTNVSNENNFSAYAAIVALQQVLYNVTGGSPTDQVLIDGLTNLQSLRSGLEKWFSSSDLLDPNFLGSPVIYQGGHVTFDGVYTPQGGAQGFAVDCQTWGLTVLGQAMFDGKYGDGAAYKLWQHVKEVAGYYDPVSGKLGGVGYTYCNTSTNYTACNIWSGEWSFGAVNMARRLANDYQMAGEMAYATDLLADAESMMEMMSQPLKRAPDLTWIGGGLTQEDGSVLYANIRFFIPWGWYANSLGATSSSAWSIMMKKNYNPFVLGGGYVSVFADPPGASSW